MKGSLIGIGTLVILDLCASAIVFARERTALACLQLISSALLAVMVCTHFAETFHLIPQMGWGLPHSAGHYIDLLSAWGGAALFASAIFCGSLPTAGIEHALCVLEHQHGRK